MYFRTEVVSFNWFRLFLQNTKVTLYTPKYSCIMLSSGMLHLGNAQYRILWLLD